VTLEFGPCDSRHLKNKGKPDRLGHRFKHRIFGKRDPKKELMVGFGGGLRQVFNRSSFPLGENSAWSGRGCCEQTVIDIVEE
jgi:hypothetical protein